MKDWKSKANWKDSSWKYVGSAATDITKTIARVKREMRELEESAKAQPKVIQIKKVASK